MAKDDWRIRIDLEEEHAHGFLERLGVGLGSRARELAKELEQARLPVSRDEDTLFVYASTAREADAARKVIEAELEEADIKPLGVRVEHWLPDEGRWDDEPPEESWEEELLDRGYAPWEVRREFESHEEAEALADELEREGLTVVRGWRYVVVGATTREEAQELARRVHGEVEPGGEVVYEVMPRNPFAPFLGGLAG